MYGLVDVLIINCSSDILELFLPVVVLVEPRVSDGVYIDMSRDLGRRFPIVIVVVVSVFGKEGVQFSGLVNRFIKGKGAVLPVDGGIGSFEPG